MFGKRESKVVCCLIVVIAFLIVGAIPMVYAVVSQNPVTPKSTPQSPAKQSAPQGDSIIPPAIHSMAASPASVTDSDFSNVMASPKDLETFVTITIHALDKPPNNPSEPDPPPTGDGAGHFGNPWKPKDQGSDITISVDSKNVQHLFNDTKNAGVWFKCIYSMWDGTAGFYKVRMTVVGPHAEISLGGNILTNFLVVGGTYVKWFINATCDQWPTPKSHLSLYYEYTVGGVWPVHQFSTNIRFDVSTKAPIIGESVIVTVAAKNPDVAMLREVVLSAIVTYPDKRTETFDTAMIHNGTEEATKTFTIPPEYQAKAGTTIKLSCFVWLYAGYDWYYFLDSGPAANQYSVSYSGVFPPGDNSFDKVCVVTTNPDIVVFKRINHSTSVNVTVDSKPDSKNLPVPIFAQIFYFINVSEQPSLNGIESMYDYSKTKKYYVLPGVTPSLADTSVTFWVSASDNEGKMVTSKKYTYEVKPLIKPPPVGGVEKDIFVILVVDYWQKIGVRSAPVNITGVDFALSSHTNDMGTLVPHEPGNMKIVHWLTVGKSYTINVSYPAIDMARDYDYVIDRIDDKNYSSLPSSKTVAGKNFEGDKTSNWSIVVEVDKNKMRTIKFIFNYFAAKVLIYAQIVNFPDFLIEYISYATVIILCIPVVILLDKRRKKAEEDEKRVTL